MTASLTFYTHPMSRGQIVRWMLEEVGAPYDQVLLDFGSTMKDAEFLAINPMGKVPAIKHGDVVVTECAAICTYLADAFPRSGLAPDVRSKARGTYYRWMFYAAGPVEAAASNKSMGWEAPADKQAMLGYGSFDHVVDTLEKAIAPGPYILGDAFSAADVYVGAHIGWGMQFGWLPKRPAFEAYYARLAARPAAVRAREIDDALVAENKPA